MKILIVKMCPINGLSSSMLRTLAVIKGLIEGQHEVDLAVMPMGNNQDENKNNYAFLDSINIFYLEKNNDYEKLMGSSGILASSGKLKNFLRTIYHAFSPFDQTYKVAKSISIKKIPQKTYDIIISDSDPKTAHIAMKRLIKQGMRYDRWIQYWGDPLTSDITIKTLYPHFIMKMIEKNLFNKADKIVYTSPFTVEEQKKIFPSYADKMFYVPTGYINAELFDNCSNDKSIVTYTGAYYSGVRNLIPLYEACEDLKDEIHCIITGDSDLQLNPTSNVTINPRGNADKELEISDLVVCVLNKVGNQIPGKIYHCAATNKKVLVIVDGDDISEIRKFIESWKRFYICENKVSEISRTIRFALKDNRKWSPLKDLSPEIVANSIISN